MPAELIPGMVCADCGGSVRWCKCAHGPTQAPHPIHNRPTGHDPRVVSIGTYLDAYIRELPRPMAVHVTAVAMASVVPGHAVSTGPSPYTDRRPHSRACGIRPHDHGALCSSDCPTCTTPPAAPQLDSPAMGEGLHDGVPLSEIDPALLTSLHKLFDRYGMRGVQQAIETMQRPHAFESKGVPAGCIWCGMPLGVAWHPGN